MSESPKKPKYRDTLYLKIAKIKEVTVICISSKRLVYKLNLFKDIRNVFPNN